MPKLVLKMPKLVLKMPKLDLPGFYSSGLDQNGVKKKPAYMIISSYNFSAPPYSLSTYIQCNAIINSFDRAALCCRPRLAAALDWPPPSPGTALGYYVLLFSYVASYYFILPNRLFCSLKLKLSSSNFCQTQFFLP